MSAERNAAIAARFAAGETRVAIARDYGISPRRVGQIALAQGVRRPVELQRQISARRLPLSRPERLQYIKIRKIIGVAQARKAMGLAA